MANGDLPLKFEENHIIFDKAVDDQNKKVLDVKIFT